MKWLDTMHWDPLGFATLNETLVRNFPNGKVLEIIVHPFYNRPEVVDDEVYQAKIRTLIQTTKHPVLILIGSEVPSDVGKVRSEISKLAPEAQAYGVRTRPCDPEPHAGWTQVARVLRQFEQIYISGAILCKLWTGDEGCVGGAKDDIELYVPNVKVVIREDHCCIIDRRF